MAATIMSGNRNVTTITLTTLAVPLLAVSLYLWLGNTKALLPQTAAEHPAMSSAGSPESGHPDFSSVLENLIARLRDQPDDIEGWLMLGRTYAMMQRFNEAKEAYEKVLALSPDNPEVLTDYADIVAMTHDGSLIGEPYELVKKALRLDARNPKALALAGTAEFEQKKYKEAAASWEKLLALIPPSEAELTQSVKASIDEAKSLASGGKGGMIARAMEQPGSQTPPPAENKPAGAAGAGAATATSGTLSGKVDVEPRHGRKNLSQRQRVYFCARQGWSAGAVGHAASASQGFACKLYAE